jgi:alpha-tubulin suppressor-like RCC1 family protein
VEIGIPAAVAIFGGRGHFCAITQVEGVWCWGANHELQAGRGEYYAPPNKISFAKKAIQLALGDSTTFALTESGEVWFWGRDNRSREARKVPVKAPKRVPLKGPVSEITAGGSHACALDLDNQIWCWGWGREMQLGNGKTDDYPGLVRVEFD